MNTDTSDSAFPLPLGNQNIDPSVAGLTKREWFAGRALGLLSPVALEWSDRELARHAYAMADAMIEEGKK